VTPHPHEAWDGCRLARNVTMQEWGFLSPGQYLMHDRDTKVLPRVSTDSLMMLGHAGPIAAAVAEFECLCRALGPLGQRRSAGPDDPLWRALPLACAQRVCRPFTIRSGRCFRVADRCQMRSPHASRWMTRPITRSCLVVVLEKPMVRRTRRVIRVRRLRCVRSLSVVLVADFVWLGVEMRA